MTLFIIKAESTAEHSGFPSVTEFALNARQVKVDLGKARQFVTAASILLPLQNKLYKRNEQM